MEKFRELEEKAKKVMKKYGATYTGYELGEEEEYGKKVVFIGGRIPYEPNYMEKERKIKEELLKELKDFDYEVIVGLVPEYPSEEERIRVIKEMLEEFRSIA
ncbi:hypothetical protein JCM9492_13730 [Aquifex pyrophilus]